MTKRLTKKTLIIIVTVVIAVAALFFILPVSIPLILALLTALIIDPLVKLVEHRFKWKRKLSVISVFIFVVLIVAGGVYFSVTSLIGRIIQFTKDAPDYLNTLSIAWIDVQEKVFTYTSGLPSDIVSATQEQLTAALTSFKDSLLELLSYEKIIALASEIPNFLVSFIVFLIALFLFMLELPQLKQRVYNRFTDRTAEKVKYMTTKLNATVKGFLKAQLLVSFIILAVAFVGLLLIVPKYAVVMAIIIWIIDVIPILGSIIVLAPWALYEFVSGDVAMGTKLSILAAVLLIIRRTVEPKVMGSQIGLSPLPTLIGMFIGLKLFGVLGFFIGPMVVILFTTAIEAGIIKLNYKI
ncbi:sporulation integral membrane protein YtvI [Sporosarcina aquimarina]|uniref:Sporulation integral membrane protein YtvI n=1 Tax=Sporosarcina aquimarina TaxID=114975 RepID=A0ABU4FXB4_9BACL|nr:sporulation integral membrane protein YtvI [Sporosarcina aquimarina]MDW0109341.1 sporulation integral membrane protein YtvI [Sporosarcina aquimarina]